MTDMETTNVEEVAVEATENTEEVAAEEAPEVVAEVAPAVEEAEAPAAEEAPEVAAAVEEPAPAMEVKPMTPAPAADTELDDSLIHKLALLETEKEALRKKLLQAAPGDVAPVYNCAAETNQIKTLESQVAFLTEENQSLQKKNAELNAAPKVESLMESDLNAKTDAKNGEGN